MNFTKGLVDQFEIMVQITAFIALVSYLVTSLAYIFITKRNSVPGQRVKGLVLGSIGFLFSLWAIFGSGWKNIIYGSLLTLLGIPFYLLMLYNKRKKALTSSNKNP